MGSSMEVNPSDRSNSTGHTISSSNTRNTRDISLYYNNDEPKETSDNITISSKNNSQNNVSSGYVKPVELFLTPENKTKVIKGLLPANVPAIKIGGVTHYAFKDCPTADIITIDGYPVHKSIKEPWQRMKEAAKAEGIDLNIVSGFRPISRQKNIFPKKFKAGVTPSDERFVSRLKESAPPGFSEHHTGYAIDICSVEESDFEKGGRYYKVGQWLKKHAKEYGFEQSFPENNSQGLIHEPWHYRYVGNDNSQEVFAVVHKNDTQNRFLADNR